MGSISRDGGRGSKKKQEAAERLAHEVAVDQRLPWDLRRLRDAALRGGQAAGDRGAINGVKAEGQRLRARRTAGERGEPTDEAIRIALSRFTVDEWKEFIDSFAERDLKPLRAYLDVNKEDLKRSLGQRRYEIVLANAVERGLVLFLERPLRVIPVTDPMWADFIRQWARKLKMELGPRPSKKRSADEMGSARAIAEGLSEGGRKVTDKQVATYFERMERIPFDQFDGNAYDYFSMIADTRAYKDYLRSVSLD